MVQCNQVSTSIHNQQRAQSMSEHLRASGNKIVSISPSRVVFCSYKVNSFHMSDDIINLRDFYKHFAATMSAICYNTILIAFLVLHQAVLTENNLRLLSAADSKAIPENNIKRGWLPSEGEGARVRRLIRWKRHFFPNQASRGGGRSTNLEYHEIPSTTTQQRYGENGQLCVLTMGSLALIVGNHVCGNCHISEKQMKYSID